MQCIKEITEKWSNNIKKRTVAIDHGVGLYLIVVLALHIML